VFFDQISGIHASVVVTVIFAIVTRGLLRPYWI
jgi:hypothetical protein